MHAAPYQNIVVRAQFPGGNISLFLFYTHDCKNHAPPPKKKDSKYSKPERIDHSNVSRRHRSPCDKCRLPSNSVALITSDPAAPQEAVFVKNLAFTVTEPMLAAFFGTAAGPVKKAVVPLR